VPNFIYCECGEATMPHTICPGCGKYRGRTYVTKDTDA
jgi:large subunit ribosomal protein L32